MSLLLRLHSFSSFLLIPNHFLSDPLLSSTPRIPKCAKKYVLTTTFESKTRLIAQNVPWHCTSQDIQSLFEKQGRVVDVELSMYNKIKNRGLAFIEMGSEEEATKALRNLELYELEGREIKVAYATSPRKEKKVVPVGGNYVYLGNLPYTVTSGELVEFFSSASVNIIKAGHMYQRETEKPTGFGYVLFGSRNDARMAISDLKRKLLMGRPILMALNRRSLKVEAKKASKIRVALKKKTYGKDE